MDGLAAWTDGWMDGRTSQELSQKYVLGLPFEYTHTLEPIEASHTQTFCFSFLASKITSTLYSRSTIPFH